LNSSATANSSTSGFASTFIQSFWIWLVA
jgi:hypothetical protein